jgi:tripartite-type tricarboxylate transporter receptor subunit TctC
MRIPRPGLAALWLFAFLLASLLASLVAGGAAQAQTQAQGQAQAWPQRPVRIVAPFAAGGTSDIAARLIAQRFSAAFGQQFLVENRAGASGMVAAESVARAPADGYTLFMATTSPISILPLISKAPYDPARDFVPISAIGSTPFVLVVHASIPAPTIADFIAYVRAHPKELTYASSGFGSLGHLSMELFLKRAGLDIAPVMYKGGTEQLNDVIAGHVKVTFLNLGTVTPFAASDAVRLLGVTSEKRWPQIPAVPTLIESGFPSLKLSSVFGFMAPTGTPQEIIGRIAGETARAVHDPLISARLLASGAEPVGSTPQDYAAMIAAELPLWAEAVKLAGLPDKPAR